MHLVIQFVCMYHVLGLFQKLLQDDRFHSSMEAEEEEKWLPMQVLNAVAVTPSLPEDMQVEVMKVHAKFNPCRDAIYFFCFGNGHIRRLT